MDSPGSRRAFETRLNVLLGRLLSAKLGMRATSEYFVSRDRPDVIVYINGVKVVLEGSYSKDDAMNDVTERLESGLGDLGVALFYKEHYPANVTDSELEQRLENSTFEARLVVPVDVSETLLRYLGEGRMEQRWIVSVTGWVEVSIVDLAFILNEAVQFILREEEFAKSLEEIEQCVGEFVGRVKEVDAQHIVAKRLYDIFYRLYGLSVGDYKQIAELIYAKAALAILLSATFYQSVCSQLGLTGLNSLCREHGYRLGVRKAFEKILEVDYRPVYSLAIQVVEALPEATGLAIKGLVELAERIASKRTLLRRDFSGRVYHKVVGDWAVRKNFATYFTTVPAAYLLAYLTIFSDKSLREDLVVGDLACGSGTLLTAIYSAIKDRYIQSRFGEGTVDLKEFHKLMLERQIWGIDALSYAVQIASTNLALQDPTTPVRSMNMFAVPLGLREDGATLGSLEFVVTRGLQSIAMYLSQTPPWFLEEAEAASITGGEIPTILPEFDVIIMNPPFTRATGRRGKKGGGLFGFIPDESVRHGVLKKYNSLRREVRRYLLQLHEQDQYRAVTTRIKELLNIGPAGEGLLFLYLAYRQIKDGGRIAFVLPKSLLSGISWYLARNLLLQKFHLEHIVVSYDAQNGYNFSESTSLSEVLIVAKRREPSKEDEPTTITLLLTKPKTALEARALAFKILKTGGGYLEVNGAKAYVYRVSRKRLVERALNWGSLVAFPEPRLTQIANNILDGKIFNKEVPMVRLDEIATIGIDAHQFHDVFNKASGRPPGSYPAVYGGKEDVRRRMLVEPNAGIVPKTENGVRLFNGFSSKLLVPDRIRVNTAHATAIYSTEPVLSNIFYAVRLSNREDEGRAKTLCLWLNTTWGILSLLANRTETEGAWIRLKMTHWRLQPMLDVTKLDERKIEKLTDAFDRYCRKELRRLPEQFDPNNIDPTREGIDKEFLEALDVKVDEKELNELYRLVHQSLTTWVDEETGVDGEEDEE
jgi:type I restriction-modification system DNA methylase subunit